MFKKLIEKYKQKQNWKILNKEVFKLDDLYVGEIVLYKKREDVCFGKIDHHYSEIKKHAFFYKCGHQKYRHVISGQELSELGKYGSIVGDYAVHNLQKFEEVFPIFMRKYNLKPSSKVSLLFLIKGEENMNKEFKTIQENVELFNHPYQNELD